MRQWWWVPWLMVICYTGDVRGELFSLITGLAAIGGLSMVAVVYDDVKCQFYECCRNPHVKFNYNNLKDELTSQVFGQHLVLDKVVTALQLHFNEVPNKALVMSFHGWTGSGKNFVAKIIAENIYQKGMRSKFVHTYVSTRDFFDKRKMDEYKAKLVQEVFDAGKQCERSLFIFDEADKMPEELINVLRPFLTNYKDIKGVDFRKNIFIFLSNEAGVQISERAYDHHNAGLVRESLSLKEFDNVDFFKAFSEEKPVYYVGEDSLLSRAWSMVSGLLWSPPPPFDIPDDLREAHSKGNLQRSELAANQLIDYYVPFLPLERKHVHACIRSYMDTNFGFIDEKVVDEVSKDLQYFPKSNPIYSASGCKRLEPKIVNRMRTMPGGHHEHDEV